MQPIDGMAQPNYSTSCDQCVDEESMDCGTASQSSVTLFSSEHNAIPKSNYFDQHSSTGQNLPSYNPYSHHHLPEYGDLSPAFAERCMSYDVVTSTSPTKYLMDSTTSNLNRNTSIIPNAIQCQRDPCNFVLQNSSQFSDSTNSGSSSTCTENQFPASCHSKIPSSSQPKRVEQSPSRQSRDDQQNIPINSSRIPPDSPKSESHMCFACNKAFTSRVDLKRHYHTPEHKDKRRVIGIIKPHKCTTCKKEFMFNSALQHHYKTSVKHINAETVPNRLNQTQQSVVHQLKIPPTFHSNNPSSLQTELFEQSLSIQSHDDQYKCILCNKTFISRIELTGHYNTLEHSNKLQVTRPLPHKCTTCKIAFPFLCKLNEHNETKKHKNAVLSGILETEPNRLNQTQQSVVHQLNIPPISNRSSHLTAFDGETTSVLINSNEQAGLNGLSQPTVFSCGSKAQSPQPYHFSIDEQSKFSSRVLSQPNEQTDQSNFFQATVFSNGSEAQPILQSNYFSYSTPSDEPNTARSNEPIFPNEQAAYRDFFEAAAFFSRD